MKKIGILTALTAILATTSAFASCPINPTNRCSMTQHGVMTGAAAPISYIVAPVQERTYLPPCTACNKATKKGFFSKIFTPVQNVYGATLGPIFTGLYD